MDDVNGADRVYRFQLIDKKFESLEGKQNRDCLIKWYESSSSHST